MSGWIGVNLDGTLAYYDEFKGIEHIGKPIVPMVLRVRRWLKEGLKFVSSRHELLSQKQYLTLKNGAKSSLAKSLK